MKFEGRFINERAEIVNWWFEAPSEEDLLLHLSKIGWKKIVLTRSPEYPRKGNCGTIRKIFSFDKVESKEEAEKILKYIGGFLFLFFLAGVLAGLFLRHRFFEYQIHYVDHYFFILVLCVSLARFRSRVGAIMLLETFLIGFGISFLRYFLNGLASVPLNTLLAMLLFVFLIVRAVQVTFNYHNILNSKLCFRHFLIKSVLGVFYSCFFYVVTYLNTDLFAGNIDYVLVRKIAICLSILSFATCYAGWLPFTKNKPVCSPAGNK